MDRFNIKFCNDSKISTNRNQTTCPENSLQQKTIAVLVFATKKEPQRKIILSQRIKAANGFLNQLASLSVGLNLSVGVFFGAQGCLRDHARNFLESLVPSSFFARSFASIAAKHISSSLAALRDQTK
jgi:hypothetical protein